MRFWVKPDQLAKLNLTVGDIIAAINAQNTPNPAGLGWRPADAARTGIHLCDHRARPARHGKRIWRNCRPRKSGRLDRAVERRRTRGTRRATLQHRRQTEWQTVRDPGDLSIARLQCARRRKARAQIDGETQADFSRRPGLFGFARHDACRFRRHEGHHAHARHCVDSRHHRRFYFSARLARIADSAAAPFRSRSSARSHFFRSSDFR